MAHMFRKKPITIEAMHYNGENANEVVDWVDQNSPAGQDAVFDPDDSAVCIKTLEGVMAAPIGWWIIRGVQGEFYPCKPDIFDQTYEAVTE